MALPNNITTITLTGEYIDFTGTPVAGQVRITMPKVLVNANANRILIPSFVTAVLDTDGAFSLTVPISNDPDLDVFDNANDIFAYTFEESFIGGSTYNITLLEHLGPSVDISDLRAEAIVTSFIQPASSNLVPALDARIAQEEEDLDDDPKLLAAPTYENLALFLDTYQDLTDEFNDYSEVDGTDLSPELNFTEARIQEIIDRIADLYDYTASVDELRDTEGTGFNAGVLENLTYEGLTAKWGTYNIFGSAYNTYALSDNGVTWNYSEIGTLLAEISEALSGTGTLTDNYLSITRTSVDGSYGAFGLQGFTYATLASTYGIYSATTGLTFSFTYRDTADRLRDEANRINRLMLIGAK